MSANPSDAPPGTYAERFHRGISEWNRLVLDDKQPAPHLQWLEDSANEHESFFRALFEAATSARGRAAKSKPFESYDLFYDLILRNAEQGRAALRWFDEGLGWQELSYGELVRDSEDLGTRWRRLGLAPGMALCIILPMGPDWLRSIAAALRLGLVISTLPLYGDAFLQHRLSLLAPDAIVIEPLYKRLLGDYQALVLEPGDEDLDVERLGSHTYGAYDEALRLISGIDAPSPRPISAHEVLNSALRDALIALDLQPGRALLPAVMDPLRAWPGIPLACLAAGATLSWLERDHIEANPRLILEHERAVVVLNSDLRERLLMRTRAPEFDGLKADTWRRWLRDPSEPLDFERWKAFLARFGLRQTPGVNLLYDSASGGAILSSRPRTDAIHNWVTPPPGLPWQLSQVPPGLQPSLGSTGAYTTFDADWTPRGPGAILLAQDRFDWLYLGTWEPRRCGAWMPALEISQLVEDLAFVEQAALVTGAPGFESSPHSFTLLAFLGAQRREDEADEGKAWREALQEQISRRLGPVFQPDELRLIPLFARRAAGATDQNWCQDLYASGSLERRLSSPLFWRLTKARARALNRLDNSPKATP